MEEKRAEGETPGAASKAPPRLSIVFSFRNEEDVIPELLRRVRVVCDGLRDAGRISGHEMLFVDDASTDRSVELLSRAIEERGDVRVLLMSRNFGVSPCVIAGMEHASGDLVVYMDADLQDPPEVIPEMLAVMEREPEVEVVHTVRLSRAGETWYKLAVTRLGYRILRAVATIDLPINAGDFKLLSRRVVGHLVALKEKRPYMRGLVSWVGFTQRVVKYHREARFGGEAKFPIFGYKVLQNFLESAVVSFSDVPLKLAMLGGMAFSSMALLYIGWILLEFIRGHNIPGWSAIMVAVLSLGGIQLFCVGILGLYIGSIFVETKRRPNYILRGTMGFTDAPQRS